MRIVFASYTYTKDFNDPKAWIKRIKGYVGIQEALGKRHEVISIEQIDYEGEYTEDDVYYYFKWYSKIDRRLPYRMHRFIKNLKPDVVFIHGLHFSLQVIQLRLHLGNNVKVIAQHHAEQPYKGFKKKIQQMADKCINAYLFASRDMGMIWVNMGNLKNANKINGVMEVSSMFYPVERQVALSKTGVTGAPVFLWVGRLNDNKDPLNVVNTFLQFAQSYPLARLYMIYHTEELLSEIKAVIDKKDPSGKTVTLIGKVPNQELLYWYNSANFFISGSFYEGSGTAVCEAMSCGCIPVVTDILSFRSMTANGECGILYEAGSQAALMNALKQSQQINLAEKRELCLNYFKQNLSFKAIARQIEQIALAPR